MSHEITFVACHGAFRESLFGDAGEGLIKYGVKPHFITHKEPDTLFAACWGWKTGQRLQDRGHQVLVFENGYVGDRSAWTSIAWNGLNGRGDFWAPPGRTMDRFNKHFSMKPWRQDGKYILLMGQVVGDMSLMGQDLTAFYEERAYQAEQFYNMPVFFRPHPVGKYRRGNFEPAVLTKDGDLQEALDDAHLVITYNSNSAVDAVLNGTPALSYDVGSMAYEVTGHHIYERIMPDRDAWAARLAHCQYNREEIREGLFWQNLRRAVE